MERQAAQYSVEQLGLEIRIRIYEKLLVYYEIIGDEFVVLLLDVTEDDLDQIAADIETKVEDRCLMNQEPDGKTLTLSQGYVILNQLEGNDVWQMIPYADEPLYEVKENGKRGHKIVMR